MKTVRGTFKFLKKQDVKYLDFTSFNEEEFNLNFQEQYKLLYNKIVIHKIFKHFGILPYNNDLIFNFFGYEDGHWYGSFYEPDGVTFDVKKVLHNDFSELDILNEYKAPKYLMYQSN